MPFQPTAARIVLVEGKEEVLLVKALHKHLALSTIEVTDYGGKDNLPGFLKGLALTSKFPQVSSLGIIRDADQIAVDAFRSVVGAVERARLEPPPALGGTGPGRPKVRVLILPDGERKGMLEDVCLASIRDQPAMGCVCGLFECLEKAGQPLPGNMSKAKVHAYLATRREPGKRLGETAGQGTWPFDSAAFEPLRAFLMSL